MKKRIFLTLILMFAGIAVVFCQPTNSDLSDALASLGISGGLATVIVTVLAVLVGKFIPQKWADPLAIIIKFAKVIIVALEWLNDKINNGNKAQKYLIKYPGTDPRDKSDKLKAAVKNAWKYLGIIVLLFAFSFSVQAQKPTSGFFKPVTPMNFSMLKGEGKTIDYLIRPVWDMTASQTYLVNKEVITKAYIGAGIGVSVLHYKDVTTNPYSDWGVNLLASFSASEAGNVIVSPVATFSYQKISAGAGYNFADKRLFILTGITLTFN